MSQLLTNSNAINVPSNLLPQNQDVIGNLLPQNQGAMGSPPPQSQGAMGNPPPQNQTPPSPPANSISTTDGNDEIAGDSSDNFILGSSGTDTITGGTGTDVMSYLSLRSGITIKAQGIVDKGVAGTDTLEGIEQIIAPLGQVNTIDASTGSGTASIDVDLSQNRLAVNNLPGIGTLNLTVENFANVKGTANVDVLTGNIANNVLEGGDGNDTLSGLRGDDILIGVNPLSAAPGSNDTDVLIGGRGRDVFVLGDESKTYYTGAGFALIQDFRQGVDRIQLRGSLSDYNIVGNSINLANTSDQIAVVQGDFTADSLVFVNGS